jgi:peptide/nickel transport system substrate-binding protein
MSTSFQDAIISFNLYDTLTSRDRDLKLIPRLATEWKATSDKTWEFKLRPNVKFHDGSDLTSADVKFSIERTYDPNAKTLVAVVFTTRQPDPLRPSRLALYGGQIIPKAYFEQVGPDEFNAKPVGSGVVKFNQRANDDRPVLDASKEYWGGAPDFEKVTLRPIPENQSRWPPFWRGRLTWR